MEQQPTDVIHTPREFDVLRTHLIDRVSSLLISMVLIVGITVAVLGSIYFSRIKLPQQESVVFLPEEKAAGRGDHAAGFARDFAPPGDEEVEQITEPSLQQSLEAVTQLVSTVSASLDTIESASTNASKGSGLGDSRPPGPLGEGADIIHRSERWELKFTARNLQGYAAQLDFFQIELAAIGGGIKTVDYAANFSGTPTKRSGTSKAEERLYFMWRAGGALEQYDRQLLQRAGINVTGRRVLKFVSDELQNQLYALEMKFAQEKVGRVVLPTELAKTIYECRPKDSGGFEWVVIDQRYRKLVTKKNGK